MSKYDALWVRIKENGADSFYLTFAETEKNRRLSRLTLFSDEQTIV